jgi:hypothetical protein
MGIGEGTGGWKMEIGRGEMGVAGGKMGIGEGKMEKDRGEMGVAVREMPIGGAEERG